MDFFGKIDRFPPRYFSALSAKKLSKEKNDILFFCIKFFDTRSFLKHWKLPQRILQHSETKKFWLKTVIHPLLTIKVFDTRIFPKPARFPPTEVFRTVKQKISNGKNIYPLFCKKNSGTRTLLNHWKFPLRNFFCHCETTNFRRKTMIPAPLLSIKFFDTWEILKHRKILPRNYSALSEKNSFLEKYWYHLLMQKLFR